MQCSLIPLMQSGKADNQRSLDRHRRPAGAAIVVIIDPIAKLEANLETIAATFVTVSSEQDFERVPVAVRGR
jgi:hypothetical protein